MQTALFGNLFGRGAGLMPGEDDLLEAYRRNRMPFPEKPAKADPYALPDAETGGTPEKGILGDGKFTGRDALGLALGAVGDAIAQQNGGQAFATPNFMSGMKARQAAEAAARKAAQIQADLESQGITPQQARLMALNPDQVGSNMASHMGAYSLGKGEQRYNNNRVVAERPDMFETPTGDRYNVDSSGKTTQVYREDAPVFHGVEGKGLYTLDRHTGADYGDRPVGRLSSAPPGGGAVPTATLPSGKPWDALQTPQIDAGAKRREFIANYGSQDGELIYQEWLKQQRGGR